jgi:hypothetical protein
MRPPVILESTTTTFTSSSSYSSCDRRLNTLARHLIDVNDQNQNQNQMASSPTASSDSVFAHLVRAPEDPILGVTIHLSQITNNFFNIRLSDRNLFMLFHFLRYFDLIRIIIIITAQL